MIYYSELIIANCGIIALNLLDLYVCVCACVCKCTICMHELEDIRGSMRFSRTEASGGCRLSSGCKSFARAGSAVPPLHVASCL